MKKLYTFLIISTLALGAAAAPQMKAPKRAAGLDAVKVLPATDITAEGFTANWQAYPGAETYCVNIYEPIEIAADGRYSVLEENFNLVSKGTMLEPEFEEELYISISEEYDWTYTPDWWVYGGVYARGMVSGAIVQSPYIDLTADGGKFTVDFSVVGYAGAQVRLTSYGSTTDVREFTLTQTGENVFSAEFTNGIHDTYLSYVDFGIIDDPEGDYAACFDFLDEITVSQQFKAGDVALRPVGIAETEATSITFEKLTYAYGAKHLAYDVQANIVTFNDPDDPYDYDVEYSDFSPLEHVYLTGYQGISSAVADADSDATFFTLRGIEVRAADLTPGLYIRRQGGKSQKVIVK